MKKSNIITTVISLLIIGALEYIIFSTNLGVFASLIGIPVLSALLCSAKDKGLLITYIVFGSVISLAVGALYGSFGDVVTTMGFVIKYLQLHLPAYVLSRCALDKGLVFKTTVIRTTGANLVVTIADLAVIKYLHKIDMTDTVSGYLSEFNQTYMSVITAADPGLKIDTQTLSKALDIVTTGFIMFMPAVIILICTIMSYVVFLITKGLVHNFTKVKVSAMSRLRFFYVGSGLSFFTFFLLILTYMSDSSYFARGVYNFALLSAFAYVVNGIAVVDFLLAKRIKSIAGHRTILIGIVILSLVSAVTASPISGLSVLFFAGLIDTSFDFRKMHRLR